MDELSDCFIVESTILIRFFYILFTMIGVLISIFYIDCRVVVHLLFIFFSCALLIASCVARGLSVMCLEHVAGVGWRLMSHQQTIEVSVLPVSVVTRGISILHFIDAAHRRYTLVLFGGSCMGYCDARLRHLLLFKSS
jgi:hypothetical protein